MQRIRAWIVCALTGLIVWGALSPAWVVATPPGPPVHPDPGRYAIPLDAPEKLNALRPIGKDFSFVVMGHVRSNEFLKIHPPFLRAMKAVSSFQPDFMVFTGDFTYGDAHGVKTQPPGWSVSRLAEEWNMFIKLVSAFDVPYFVVPGNHELQGGAEAEKVYHSIFGPTSGSFKLNGFNFVFLNSTTAGTKHFKGLPDAQKQMAQQFKSEADRTFLFVHHRMWRKDLYGAAAYEDPDIQYTFAGDTNRFEWEQSGSKIKIASGLESYTDDWVRDLKEFFGQQFEMISFVRVVVQDGQVTLYKVVVDPESGRSVATQIGASSPTSQ